MTTTPDQGISVPDAPPVDDGNRFSLTPLSVSKIHDAAALLETDANQVANGAAQLYHYLADLLSKGWIIAGVSPEDGQTYPIVWSGFEPLQPPIHKEQS